MRDALFSILGGLLCQEYKKNSIIKLYFANLHEICIFAFSFHSGNMF